MKLDFDSYGFLDFTQNNIDLINFCLSVDSTYRHAFDTTYKDSSAWEIVNNFNINDRNSIKEICKKIDKENSTHINVGEGGKGLDLVVDTIMNKNNLEDRLKSNDMNLVNEIANAVKNVSKFSFASKFCTYVARYRKLSDNYSIYDRVISEMLPCYEWKYLKTKNHIKIKNNKNKASIIADKYALKGKFNYAGYNDLIGRIINEINKQNPSLNINRDIFDRLLWYYYKGDKKLRQECLNKIP